MKKSNKTNQNPNDLVPSGNRGLTADKSGLVKRGLELIQKHEIRNRQIRVLIGELDENFTSLVSALIRRTIGDKCVLKIVSTAHSIELLEHARSQTFDAFILVLNNIIFPSDNLPPEKRIEKSLQLITHLRTEHKRPIIALAGLSDDPLFANKVKLAGADFFFRIPFNPKAFQAAITQVLAI